MNKLIETYIVKPDAKIASVNTYQNNVEYLYYLCKTCKTKEQLVAVLMDKLDNFKKTKKNSRRITNTKEFIGDTINLLRTVDDYQDFKRKVIEFLEMGKENKIQFMELFWNNPELKSETVIRDIQHELQKQIE